MRYLFFLTIAFSLFFTSCGITSRMGEEPQKSEKTDLPEASEEKIEEGVASWYGPNFHGKLTANGEKYDMHGITAAHRTLPFNSVVRVNNLDNGKSVDVRINDRGPYAKDRIIDLSKKAAQEVDMIDKGTANVELLLLEGQIDESLVSDLKVPTYSVQLASYKDEDQAFDHSRKIRGSRVETIEMEDQTIYRVYFGLYVDEDEAREKRDELKQQGFEGYVKQIQN